MKKRIKYKLEKKQHLIDDLEFHEYCEERKKGFPDGPWNNEPNKVYFKEYGFDCMVKRQGNLGFLCGYVGVTKEHPLFNVHYSNDEYIEVHSHAHGGITFSELCVDNICHPGKNKVFWIGFDCGHFGDYIPKITPKMYGNVPYNDHLKKIMCIPQEEILKEYYKDIEYVKEACKDLARYLRYNY